MSFCNEVENDLGPDWLNESERDLTLVGLAGPFEALPQPVSVPPSQDPQPEGQGVRGCWGSVEESELEMGVLELEEELSSKLVFFLPPTAESHSTPCCYYGKAKRLSTCVSGSAYVLYACMYCMHDVPYVNMFVSGDVFHGLGPKSN